MSQPARSSPRLVRETLSGRTLIAASRARLLGDQMLQAAELALAIGEFGKLDGEQLAPGARGAIAKLKHAHDLARQARLALRSKRPGTAP